MENKIDEFITTLQKYDSWYDMLPDIRKFQKETGFELSKTKLIASYRRIELNNPTFFQALLKKKVRGQSGVLPVTIFTSARPEYTDKNGKRKKQNFSCKHDCWYCPLEPANENNNFVEQPRSYLTQEPGVLRANVHNYDCVGQMQGRCSAFVSMGQPLDKLEVLVLGGTWSEYPPEYQEEYVRDIYYAANTFFVPRKERLSLEEEQKINETTQPHIIGLTLETRPDTITLDEIARFRRFGCTRLQLGVQHTNDHILKKCNRGHNIQCVKDALKLLKNTGYKIDIHLMPNLRDASPEIDEEMFKEVLTCPELQADQWKIYPCSVVSWSMFEKMYNDGRYKPYSDDLLLKLLVKIAPTIHPWIRVNRIIRDIPMQYISGGCSTPNMSEIITKELKAKGESCKCIRCREIKDMTGIQRYFKYRVYEGSGGTEYFLSYESKDCKYIFGFLRLRLVKNTTTFDELKNVAMIRELHCYGPVRAIKNKNTSEEVGVVPQHTGIGSSLLWWANAIAYYKGYRKISVISGIGVRNYYRARGFTTTSKNGYLIKQISLFEIIYNLFKGVYVCAILKHKF